MIAQNKVLVRAGRFQGGKLPYVNYVGQIKPADMASIVWYGAFGDDTTGDGTISTPYETFAKALAEFSTITHKWVLNTDLTVYGESEPAAFIDDPADRVYLDPTKADDSGDGLTAANAKKTYAAAKTVLGSSGRAVIHCIGTFTLSDIIDSKTQGEIGETLTHNASVSTPNSIVFTGTSFNGEGFSGVAENGGTIIAVMRTIGGTVIKRSTDGFASHSNISNPWSASNVSTGIAYGGGVWVISGSGGAVLRSTDDGLTWAQVTVANSWRGVIWAGAQFVMYGQKSTSVVNSIVMSKSTDGTTWTAVSSAWDTDPLNSFFTQPMVKSAAGTIYFGGFLNATGKAGLQKSTDGGSTWTDISATFVAAANAGSAMCIVSAGSAWYVFGTKTGPTYNVWKSLDDGATWAEVTGYAVTPQPIVCAAYSESLSGVVFFESSGSLMRLLKDDVGSTLYASASLTTGQEMQMFEFGGEYFGLICGKDDASQYGQIEKFGAINGNIIASATNLQVDVSNFIKTGATVNLANVSALPTSGSAIIAGNELSAKNCRFQSADGAALSYAGAKIKIKRSIVKGVSPAVVKATASTVGDVEIMQNVIAGGVAINNVAGTDKETIQDNIIIGNFSATDLVTVKSNVSGSIVNSTSQSVVSTIPPIFVDTTDFFLSRIALGQTVDSPLISRSAYFTFTYSAATFKDDFGPYRAFTALVETVYKRAFLLPHFSGNALSEDVENVAALLKSIRGKPDVSNRPQGRLEIVSWQSKSVNSEVREFVSFMEKEKDLTVYIDYDFNGQAPDAVTIDGVHTSGTFELNIVPQDIPVGTVLSLFGKSQIVTQRYPRAGQATKLILDDVLSGGLVDTESVQVTYIQGAGTFVFVPSRPRKNLRIFARSRGSYSGMTYTFVRKAE